MAAYSPNLGEAIAWAADMHRAQLRKGKSEPYLTHLLRVCSLVLKYGGTEEQAIAGVLHDAPEDCGGQPILDAIGVRFGPVVKGIVSDCSDSLTDDPEVKAPYRERKIAHLKHMVSNIGDLTVLVAACDKISNLEDVVDDLRSDGESTLDRFKGGPEGTRAYYLAMYSILGPRLLDSAQTRFAELLTALGVDVPQLPVAGDPVAAFDAATLAITV